MIPHIVVRLVLGLIAGAIVYGAWPRVVAWLPGHIDRSLAWLDARTPAEVYLLCALDLAVIVGGVGTLSKIVAG